MMLWQILYWQQFYEAIGDGTLILGNDVITADTDRCNGLGAKGQMALEVQPTLC